MKKWFGYVAGFLAAAVMVGVFNVIAGLIAMAIHNPFAGIVIGAAPGLIVAFVMTRVSKSEIATGILIGAAFLSLIGGLCGYSMAGAQ